MHETPIKSLVYLSAETEPFDPLKLSELQQQAADNNQRLGITGYLCYDRKRFLQCIEGDRDAVDDLFESIRKDARHEMLAWDAQMSPVARRFPGWAMRWITSDELREISMETLLSDQLLLIGQVYHGGSRWRETVWQMVGRLAQQQSKLPPMRG